MAKEGFDPLTLSKLLESEPSFFDSLWYGAFPVSPVNNNNESQNEIDRLMNGGEL